MTGEVAPTRMLNFRHRYDSTDIHFKRLNMFVPHKTLVLVYVLHVNLCLCLRPCLPCVYSRFFVWLLVNKAVIPVPLWAEVTHQMAGPEQRTCIGAKCREEDSGTLHVTLQAHEAHRDIHCRYVIGVSLKEKQRNKNQTGNWWQRENPELHDQQQASKWTARERLGRMYRTNKTCMMYVHAMGKSECLGIKGNLSLTTFSRGIRKLIYFYTLTKLKAKHWQTNWTGAKQVRIWCLEQSKCDTECPCQSKQDTQRHGGFHKTIHLQYKRWHVYTPNQATYSYHSQHISFTAEYGLAWSGQAKFICYTKLTHVQWRH